MKAARMYRMDAVEVRFAAWDLRCRLAGAAMAEEQLHTQAAARSFALAGVRAGSCHR
jgi:hypothetical protein